MKREEELYVFFVFLPDSLESVAAFPLSVCLPLRCALTEHNKVHMHKRRASTATTEAFTWLIALSSCFTLCMNSLNWSSVLRAERRCAWSG